MGTCLTKIRYAACNLLIMALCWTFLSHKTIYPWSLTLVMFTRAFVTSLFLRAYMFRPSLLSSVYLVFLLVLPVIPNPTPKSMVRSTGFYLKVLLAVSTITFSAQLGFQVLLFFVKPYAAFLKNSHALERAFRQCGFVRLDDLPPHLIILWISPEIIMFLSSIVIHIVCQKLVKEANVSVIVHGRKRRTSIIINIAICVVLASLALIGIVQPSVVGALYFLVFLGSMTYWSCCKELGTCFARILQCLTVVVVCHIILLYSYQFSFTVDILGDSQSRIGRLFALKSFYDMDENDHRWYSWHQLDWDSYLNPLALLWFCYISAPTASILLKKAARANVIHHPMRGRRILHREIHIRHTAANLPKGRKSHNITANSSRDQNNLKNEANIHELYELEYKPTFVENVLFVIDASFQAVIHSSYILTNIVMMAWSITYLSWLTFVFLLWAMFFWLIPQQRKFTLICSPLLVAYSIFLLLAAYIYSMQLTEEELPTSANLAQIGFERVTILPINNLIVKCIYTGAFWITMRQYIQEKLKTEQSVSDIENEKLKVYRIVRSVSEFTLKLFTKLWIWVVATMLFVVAVTGRQVNGFRIIYMVLFLIFVMTFQISYLFWRKMLLVFWMTVIIYSMAILVMLYTYQFDNFPFYWEMYLKIPRNLHLDIGLERYRTSQLFVRLATPTIFVIITAIHLCYFHHGFLEISSIGSATVFDDYESLDSEELIDLNEQYDGSKIDFTDLAHVSKTQLHQNYKKCRRRLSQLKNIVLLFLELHLPKAVLLMAMLLCIYDRCAVYLVVILLITLSLIFGRPIQVIAIYATTILVSFVILMRMVYQIELINHEKALTSCSVTHAAVALNNAEWLGFHKLSEKTSLAQQIKWNIIYLTLTTLWSAVVIHQMNYRLNRGKEKGKPCVMFPDITRADADTGIINCLMYLLNYGFYKFGIEICFMVMVMLMGFRMDLYAGIHAIVLCMLVGMKRSTLAKIWHIYLVFIAATIVFQYIMVIGPPPFMCYDHPWDKTSLMGRFQSWAFLFGHDYRPPAEKLIFDVILLLMVSRQAIVFRREYRFTDKQYPGGTNRSIIHLFEKKGFVNPVPDFVSYVTSYLDILKRMVLLNWLWFTTAMLFLTGTDNVNIFSLGYLIGTFTFLWQGTALYLRSIPSILKSWNMLIAYNVFVMVVKIYLQILGCIFIVLIPENFCWPFQLFAVSCVQRFENNFSINDANAKQYCKFTEGYNGLLWDVSSFCCLIIQKRIFKSYYFFHIIEDVKVVTILISRGHEFIEQMRKESMKAQEEKERKLLNKIQERMQKIKENQMRIQGTNYEELRNHFNAVLAGDYYMFDDIDEEELDEADDSHTEDDFSTSEEDTASRPYTVSELLSVALKTDIKTTLKRNSQVDFRRASTTSDEEEQKFNAAEYLESASEERLLTVGQKIVDFLLFIWAFIDSLMVSIIMALNRHTKDHRLIMKKLSEERKILKETTDYSTGIRLGWDRVWSPMASFHGLMQNSRKINTREKESITEDGQSFRSFHSVLTGHRDGGGAELVSHDQPTIVQLLLAFWHAIIYNSDTLCYMMVFLNQIRYASLLSLPLPLMVFFWGSLSTPIASKTFWVSIIAYTEVIVILKTVFQLDFVEWNNPKDLRPLYPPRIIGIEKRKLYAIFDLLLLLVVFFHRYLLKSLGLWKSIVINDKRIAEGDYRRRKDQLILLEDAEASVDKIVPTLPISQLMYGTVMQQSEGSKHHLTQNLVKKQKHKQHFKNLVLRSRSSKTQSLESDLSVESQHDIETDVSAEDLSISSTLLTQNEYVLSLFSEEGENKVFHLASYDTDIKDHYLYSLRMALRQYGKSIQNFFVQMRHTYGKTAKDVYLYMFLCDFFNFFLILFGYSKFGTVHGEGGIGAYLQDNRVPPLFIILLLIHFLFIMIDRAIYLKKNIAAKIVFHYIQVILLHLWLFYFTPLITERKFNASIIPQIYYIVKCIYLLLSVYQIHCGYPTRILGNFLCKGYSYFHIGCFKVFMSIPFLFELRAVMDWMWTDTSMTLFEWIKLEDIFANIYQVKCFRYVEKEYPQPAGEKKSIIVKYLMGSGMLLFIIISIWFPLIFFSLGKAVGEPNIPEEVMLELRIGAYQPLYTMSARVNGIFALTEQEYRSMLGVYSKNTRALSFLNNYGGSDIAVAKFILDSAWLYQATPPDRERMIQEMNSTKPIYARMLCQVMHKTTNQQSPGTLRTEVSLKIEAFVDGKQNPVRRRLYEMLLGGPSDPAASLGYILPKFLKVTNRGELEIVKKLMSPEFDGKQAAYLRKIQLRLQQLHDMQEMHTAQWWEIQEKCNDTNYANVLRHLPYANCDFIILYTFNDRIFPQTFSLITGTGIIGMYMLYFFVIFSTIRAAIMTNLTQNIWLQEMPNADRIYKLIMDIYMARAMRIYTLEEQLFAKVIFIMRSRETAIKMSRKFKDTYNPEFIQEPKAIE